METPEIGVQNASAFTSLNIVGNIDIVSSFPCNLCELFLTCIDNSTTLYQDIRHEFGNIINYETDWQENDLGILSRRVRYEIILDDEKSVVVDETHYLSLGEIANGGWSSLKLNIASHFNESEEDAEASQILSWELDFSVADGMIKCCVRCLSRHVSTVIADKIFNFDILSNAVTKSLVQTANDDRRLNLVALESDELESSESWLRLVACSTLRGEVQCAQNSDIVEDDGDIKTFHEMLSQPATPCGSLRTELGPEHVDDGDNDICEEPLITQVVQQKPMRSQILSDEYVYFSMRLGVNFRLQSGNVMVGSLELPGTAGSSDITERSEYNQGYCIADDDETCTLLSSSDIKTIRDRCSMEDIDYVTSLNVVGYNRARADRMFQATAAWQGVSSTGPEHTTDTKVTDSHSAITDPETGTFADMHGREKLWAYGPDTVKPTYYINAGPQRVGAPPGTATAATDVVNPTATPARAVPTATATTTPTGASSNTATVTAHAIAVPQHGSSLNDDPRSPSARTPIAPVVNAVALGPVERDDPFEGLEVDDYQAELLATVERERSKTIGKDPSALSTSEAALKNSSMSMPPVVPSCLPRRDSAFATAVASMPPPPPPPSTAQASTISAVASPVSQPQGLNLGGIMDMEVRGNEGDLEESKRKEVDKEVPMKKESCKILVLCPVVFGDAKKIWKADLSYPSLTSDEADANDLGVLFRQKVHQSMEKLVESLAAKYDLPYPFWDAPEVNAYIASIDEFSHMSKKSSSSDASSQMRIEFVILDNKKHRGIGIGDEIVTADGITRGVVVDVLTLQRLSTSYFDADVDETVSLDDDAFADFIAQKKKVLNVQYDTSTRVAKVEITSIQAETANLEESQQAEISIDVPSSVPTDVEETKQNRDSPFSSPVVAYSSASSTTMPVGETGDSETQSVTIYTTSAPTIQVNSSTHFGQWEWIAPGGGPRVGSKLASINGVRLRGLDRSLILTLLKQRCRPLVLEFEGVVSNSSPTITTTGPNASESEAPTDASETVDRDSTTSIGASASNRPISTDSQGQRSSSTSAPRRLPSRDGTTSIYNQAALRPASRLLTDDSGSNRDQSRIPASTFLAKYSHPLAKPLRQQVDKVLKSFVTCDWTDAQTRATGGTPQTFVTSLYRSIESELDNLGLFDSTKPQGGGIPPMQESHWTDVRSHIESMVFNTIYDYTWSLGPAPELYSLVNDVSEISSHVQTLVDHTVRVPLQSKLAYLGFLSLNHMGLDMPPHLTHPTVYFPYVHNICQGIRTSVPSGESGTTLSGNAREHRRPCMLPEEWRLALREFCAACDMKSPLKIMQRLKSAISMGTHALEAMLSHPEYYKDPSDVGTEEESDVATAIGYDSISHLLGDDGSLSASCRYRLQRRAIHRAKMGFNTSTMLGADELMPLLAWMIIQANPPNIDRVIWLSTEFRHHTLQMGEYAYALTQISSALEFCKEMTWENLVISKEEYMLGIRRYELTMDLIQACKKGDSFVVRELILNGADVNGRSVDQSETPLSTSIKHRQVHIVTILLATEGIDVNGRISPYHTPSLPTSAPTTTKAKSSAQTTHTSTTGTETTRPLRDYTPLMLAAISGNIDLVSLILQHGGDRALANGNGDTAATLAYQSSQYDIVRMLMADPVRVDLFHCIRENDMYMIRGLINQAAVDVNRQAYISSFGNVATLSVTDEKSLDGSTVAATALMLAVRMKNVNIVNVLLNNSRVNVNIVNSQFESALMWCGLNVQSESPNSVRNEVRNVTQESLQDDIVRMDIALSLLRAGADRYAKDQFGQTAYVWAMCGGVSGVKVRVRMAETVNSSQLSALAAVAGGSSTTSRIVEEDFVDSKVGVDEEDTSFLDTSPFAPPTITPFYPRLAAVLYYNPEIFHIWDLAREGDLNGVRALLEQGISINSSCPKLHYTPLIAAVHKQDVEMVTFLLENSSIDVNKCGNHNMTPLHYSAQNGNAIIAGMLLRYGADRNAKNDTQLTPFDYAASGRFDAICDAIRFDPKKVSVCLAAKHGDMKVFRSLISQGVSVNAKLRHVSEKGCHHELTTPLIAAVYYDQQEFIKSLVAMCPPKISAASQVQSSVYQGGRVLGGNTSTVGAVKASNSLEALDINCSNMLGQTPLMYAASRGNESIVLYLLQLNADRNMRDGNGDKASDWAKKQNFQSIYMILICDPAVSSVHAAIREGNIEATVAYFKQNPNPNQRWFLNQSYASSSGIPATGALPSGVTSSPNTLPVAPTMAIEGVLDGEPPLVVAAKYNRVAIINILLRAPGIDIDIVDTFGKTPLMHAAECGQEESVLLLLKHKANRYAMDYTQQTAVHHAVRGQHNEVVAILEADPYKVYVHDACESGQVHIVQALLKQGCPVNFKDERTGKHSRTPLMSAAGKGQLEVVELLTRTTGINLNAQDSDGLTALMHAARIGDLEITGLLLTCGCDRSIVDKKGRNADAHASSHGYMTMLQFKGQQMVR